MVSVLMRKVPVQAFLVKHECERCKSEDLRYDGTLMSNPPRYAYTCGGCSHTMNFREAHGQIVYEEIPDATN